MNDEHDDRDPDIYSGELTHDADLGPETDDTDSESPATTKPDTTTPDTTEPGTTEGESHE